MFSTKVLLGRSLLCISYFLMLLIKEEYLTYLLFLLKVYSSVKLYSPPDEHIEWPAAMTGEELLLIQCHTL